MFKLHVLDPHGYYIVEVNVTGSSDHFSAAIDNDTSIQFGCEAGTCGACLFKTDHPEAFNRPSHRESMTLKSLGSLKNERLTCVSELNLEFTGTVKIWNAFAVYNPIKP